VLVDYFRAFTACYQALEALVRGQRVGALRAATVHYSGTLESAACHALERLVGMLGAPAGVVRHAGPPDAPLFSVSWSGGAQARCVPVAGLEYSLFELELFFERARLRVVDGERRVESFESRADAVFAGHKLLAPATLLEPSPSHEIVGAVLAAVRAAETAKDDGASLARALEVARILEQAAAR